MNPKPFCLAALLSTGLVMGCDPGEPTTPPTPQVDDHAGHDHADGAGHDHDAEAAPGTSLTEQAGEMASDVKDKTVELAGDAKDATVSAYGTAKEETKEAVDTAAKKVDAMIVSDADTTATTSAPGEAAAAAPAVADDTAAGLTLGDLTAGMTLDSAQADAALDKVKTLIGEKNYDLAAQWVTKLQDVELPAGYAEKLTALKDTLQKAQGAGDMLKGLGG